MSVFIEDGLYSYLKAQSTINSIVGDRIYPSILPQDPVLPAITFHVVSSEPVSRQDGKPVLEKARIQIDAYASQVRNAKLLAKAIRDSLEAYVGLMGTISVQAVFVLDYGMTDFEDVPSEFRVISEYEIWYAT